MKRFKVEPATMVVWSLIPTIVFYSSRWPYLIDVRFVWLKWSINFYYGDFIDL